MGTMFPAWLSAKESSNPVFGGAWSLPMMITVPVQVLCIISLVFVLFALNVEQVLNLANRRVEIPTWITKLRQHISAWRLCGGYGLFANMTTDRREIIIEGSVDGENWLEYSLPYKPSAISRAMTWTWPGHMPRLDWRMWFLPFRRNQAWFDKQLFHRLLEGSPAVLSLFSHNPFPTKAPTFVRAVSYKYEFSN